MKPFEYGDQEIGKKEILFAVASVVLALAVLTLPRAVADATRSSDGWISILIGGSLILFFTWIVAKLAARFPKQTFFEYTSLIVTKPIAYLLTILFAVQNLLYVSFEIRGLATVSKQYLFDRTPIEVTSLVFLLTLIYAVSGSRVALLRLNLMFLPVVLLIGFLLLFIALGFIDFQHFKPYFITGWKDILKGVNESATAFLGIEILLFYIAFMKDTRDAPKAAVTGVSIPFIFYFTVFIVVIGVSGVEATMTMVYPTIELAKGIEVPGEFFERFESLFFTIWIMTIFNTAAMFFDIILIALGSIFRNVKKLTWIVLLSPLIYLVAMTPQSVVEYFAFGKWINNTGFILEILLPPLLLIIAKLRGVKGHG